MVTTISFIIRPLTIMYSLLILFISLPLIYSQCDSMLQWFNENHPWDSQSNGHDIERFSLIQTKYPSIFEYSRWTGYFEIRNASYQKVTDETMLIESYTRINDGFICHAINGKQCLDHEIGFCLESNLCGITKYPPDEIYIAGGQEVRPHSLPWHVSIQYNEKHICEGTLIDDQHVLTAASCIQSNPIPIAYSVVLGAHYLSNSTDRIFVDSLRYHQDYNIQTLEDNIGLIKLSQRIPSFSDRIAPSCLAQSVRQLSASNPVLVASWRTMTDGTWSVIDTDELRQTLLTVMDDCSRVYKNYDPQKQLCIGSENSKRDLCQGDHGSGLFQKQKYDVDRWIQIGIGNYGCEHAPQGHPGVYTRVSAYSDWIETIIKEMK